MQRGERGRAGGVLLRRPPHRGLLREDPVTHGGAHLPAPGRAARGTERWASGTSDLGLDSTLAGLAPSALSSREGRRP